MTAAATRAMRLVAAVGLAMLMVSALPTAAAASPPPIDDTLLPAPGPPSPPEPSEQQGQCLVSTGHRAGNGNSGQLRGLALTAVRQLSRGAGQTVAVIDTGVARHRLLPRLIPGGDYVHTGDGTEDCDGHGTVVAGIIGATMDSDGGFGGVAPEATIVSIRQSSNKYRPANQPTGSGFGDVDTLAMAVRTAADLGATVINVSSVACLSVADAPDDRALGAALAYAVDVKNVVVVAAAGNVGRPGQCPEQNPPADPAGPGQPDWESVKVVVSPAWYDDLVLTVASVRPDGSPSDFTVAGPWVDVAASGEGVVSLDPDGEGVIDTLPGPDGPSPILGTSYAAPVVSGIAALVRSRWPHLTARQVMQHIEHTARRPPARWDPFVGHGVVDALAAVSGDVISAATPQPEVMRTVSPAQATPHDPRPRNIALAGMAICLAAVAALMAINGSDKRLRGPDAVPHD